MGSTHTLVQRPSPVSNQCRKASNGLENTSHTIFPTPPPKKLFFGKKNVSFLPHTLIFFGRSNEERALNPYVAGGGHGAVI